VKRAVHNPTTTTSRRHRKSSGPRPERRRLFAALSRQELLRRGVPKTLIPALHALATPEELTALLGAVRTEIAQLLARLAASVGLKVSVTAPSWRAAARNANPEPTPTIERDSEDPDMWLLPARMQSYAERNGIRSLRDLARVAPRSLRTERNLGHKTIQQTRALIKQRLGVAWENPPPEPRALRPNAKTSTGARWDLLRTTLPEAVRATALDDLRLSARVCSYATREGLHTLGDLANHSSTQMFAAKNFGRRSLAQVLEVARGLVEQASAGDRSARPTPVATSAPPPSPPLKPARGRPKTPSDPQAAAPRSPAARR
jgi:hypothetical protein